ncbi:hypothetical protein PENTCL1PPCAC_4529, partial [Pristionchus entomophagus]
VLTIQKLYYGLAQTHIKWLETKKDIAQRSKIIFEGVQLKSIDSDVPGKLRIVVERHLLQEVVLDEVPGVSGGLRIPDRDVNRHGVGYVDDHRCSCEGAGDGSSRQLTVYWSRNSSRKHSRIGDGLVRRVGVGDLHIVHGQLRLHHGLDHRRRDLRVGAHLGRLRVIRLPDEKHGGGSGGSRWEEGPSNWRRDVHVEHRVLDNLVVVISAPLTTTGDGQPDEKR